MFKHLCLKTILTCHSFFITQLDDLPLMGQGDPPRRDHLGGASKGSDLRRRLALDELLGCRKRTDDFEGSKRFGVWEKHEEVHILLKMAIHFWSRRCIFSNFIILGMYSLNFGCVSVVF